MSPPDELSKPEKPNEEDCCHNGCQNCVFDVYLQALEKWKRPKEAIGTDLRYDLISLTKFKPFVLVNVKKTSEDTNIYTLKPYVENCDQLSGYLPYSAGQYLAIRLDNTLLIKSHADLESDVQNDKYLIRDFTIISLSSKRFDCSFDMIIKLYEGSATSNYFKSLDVGDISFWRGPYGDFKYIPNTYTHLIMFCMGTGVAPMYPIACGIVESQTDDTFVSLHFGSRTSYGIILRDEIEGLSSFWNFTCQYYLSEEKDLSNKKYREQFVLSKITEKSVEEAIRNKSNYFILVCGSEIFINDVKGFLEKLNVDECKFFLF